MIPGNLGIIFTGDTQYPLSESGEQALGDWTRKLHHVGKSFLELFVSGLLRSKTFINHNLGFRLRESIVEIGFCLLESKHL